MGQQIGSSDVFKEWLDYNPETGEVFWKKPLANRIKAGAKAGCLHKKTGYMRLRFQKMTYMLHRVIWLMQTGSLPKDFVDHRDQDKANNKWSNLRAATQQENMRNRPRQKKSKSGIKGVVWSLQDKVWRATARVDKKTICIGSFEEKGVAAKAYQDFAKALHGDFYYDEATS